MEDVAIIDIAHKAGLKMGEFAIDTGRLNEETYEVADALVVTARTGGGRRDREGVRRAVQKALGKENYELFTAPNGDEAIRIVKDHPAEIAICISIAAMGATIIMTIAAMGFPPSSSSRPSTVRRRRAPACGACWC